MSAARLTKQEQKERIEQARILWGEGVPTAEIATRLSVTPAAVSNWKKAFGWPDRPRANARKTAA